LNIEFDDEEDLMENEIIQQYGAMKYEDIIQLAGVNGLKFNKEPEDNDDYPISPEDLKKIAEKAKSDKDSGPSVKRMLVGYQLGNLVKDIIVASDSQGKFNLSIDIFGECQVYGHTELKFSSAGVGAIGAMVYNVLSEGPRRQMKHSLQCVLDGKNPFEYEDMDGNIVVNDGPDVVFVEEEVLFDEVVEINDY
jgi:hypothetical protein